MKEIRTDKPRTCTGCGLVKPTTAFKVRPSSADGISRKCRTCIYRAEGTRPFDRVKRKAHSAVSSTPKDYRRQGWDARGKEVARDADLAAELARVASEYFLEGDREARIQSHITPLASLLLPVLASKLEAGDD